MGKKTLISFIIEKMGWNIVHLHRLKKLDHSAAGIGDDDDTLK